MYVFNPAVDPGIVLKISDRVKLGYCPYQEKK